ncbi:MAG: type I toxin-antitoxin system Fst family toxin [Furfurilactobacillus sp.]|jgi:capsular polysaccharide biosynthesis protein|uniref:Type I toxin-antitoxin system Fst family toxin n=1 Tax=Furfurilactobacillus milii TaxID=2888272 RepID=A0ABT6DB38_9LACO|nr:MULTISPECIES: type I toxin-antitoxin system Fst family toxin [Furfurilactobacillus]MCF6161394.1 type I toxin-antitoxin system Fst family toxin [Furfurilactobacillus milii]MCF6163774.1 type I toxin-antitoxin system Fst family toxin [Furfurilactobacillus milii]MCF6419548.1 type I toxin-antitoxin system Fst family toxin [Furfurilactobacillus milii]MCH4011680.1 type I toxin-antitoxin system Fst family toxin [Furfurilactobacillus sp.]MCH4037572.1 type I toxin-antitoxin system Fst family toxin [F
MLQMFLTIIVGPLVVGVLLILFKQWLDQNDKW